MLYKSMNGAEALIKALIENDVDTVFGYPGGAVLPVYDAIFKNNRIRQALEALGDALSKAQLNRQNALKEVASVR